MNFRIDVVSEEKTTVIRVTGVLSQGALAELTALFKRTSGPITLELTDLSSMDAELVPALMRLTGKEVPIRGLTPYLTLLLYGERGQLAEA